MFYRLNDIKKKGTKGNFQNVTAGQISVDYVTLS